MSRARVGMFVAVVSFVALIGLASWAQNTPPTAPAPASGEKMLFNFETEDEVKAWTPLAIENSKLPGAKEPAPTVDFVNEGTTCGKFCMKITYDGGRWPTLTTTAVPIAENWMAQKFVAFKADVTVNRTCLVGFRVLTENRPREKENPWGVTKLCTPGKNEIVQLLAFGWTGMEAKDGKITGVDIFMYSPRKGEAIYVDNVRLTTEKPPVSRKQLYFDVLGTDLKVTSLTDLGRRFRDQWKPPVDKPVDQVEAEFKAKLDALKAAHPKAVLAILRDGEKGYDPANPDKVYKGWMMRHINSHGPDSAIDGRSANIKGWGSLEAFMRHRSIICQVDLASIPKGSNVLAAQFVLTRATPVDAKGERGPAKANQWVAEAINRPWVETEVNAYEFAKDKFWKSVGGMSIESYEGNDPDFWPVYIAHGPSTGVVNVWDFTDAVKFWLDGKHVNDGFFFHGDGTDYIQAFTYDAKNVNQRPAVMVIYEPK